MTFRPDLRSKITVRAIACVVAETCGATLNEMRSLRRERRISRARHMIAGLAKELTERSFGEIGLVMNKDHSTIMHGADRCAVLLASDDEFRCDYFACRDVLAALAERDLIRAAEGIDPVAVAQRIMKQGDRGVHGASFIEIRAMAEFIASAASEADTFNDVSKALSGDDCHDEADLHAH